MENLTVLKVITTRKIKKIFVNRFAVSPIFATLIILAIVTVMFIPIFIWATGTSSENEDFWEESGLVVTERVVIEQVNIQNDGDCIIYVRNIGKTDVTINNILITLPNGNNQIYNSGDFSPTPEYVTKGELITIENVLVSYLTGIYSIKVITPRGVSDTFQVVVD